MNQKDQFNEQCMPRNKYNKILLSIFFLVLILSAIKPHDYFTWFLEVLPALIGIVVIWYLKKYHKFEFTRLVLFWLLVHSIVLMIGAHWTYAEVPFFNWLRDIGLFSRNNYDKVGHFMQGFVPVLVAREVLIRETPLNSTTWINFLSLCVVQAAGSVYELFEWLVSVLSGSAGDSFLGTQGDIWDTQSDMLFCLIGALAALLFMGKIHNEAIEKIKTLP
jgi:putative membrane protein